MSSLLHVDLLKELSLPDRYERLVEVLDAEVANLLVSPPHVTNRLVSQISQEIRTRSEGVLIPLFAPSGTGKTTFVMNIAHWHPSDFTPTYLYQGPVEYESLHDAISLYEKELPADNRRIIPINVDHRESDPPDDRELATIKRFLRTNTLNAPCAIFWPETNRETAERLSKRYINIAGRLSVALPVTYDGPDKGAWSDIATHTLSLANRISDLEELGVDPRNYVPSEYRSIGDFLRTISHDFNTQLQELREQIHKPLSLLVAFVTETPDPGILSQLTSAARYGLLDSHALISVTEQSEIGKWWAERRGLLTRSIVQLNAHAISVPPAASASCVRNFSDSVHLFDHVGYRRYGPAKGARDLGRSDLGKILT